ncbi:MAG TPA: OmpA family protein [Gammaproteobacteria bacterium]
MTRLSVFSLCAAAAFLPAANAAEVEEAPLGETVERHLGVDGPFMHWVQDPDRVAADEGDTLATREVAAEALETVKLTGLVPPIHFASGVADIPGSTLAELGRILERMQHRRNVRLHFVGHADNQPLSDALARIYGDNIGLSRERAGEVAEYFQTALALPPEAVSYDWAGDTQPVASNETEAGRALNRRVEVEVWYDEVRERLAVEEVVVPQDSKRVKVCRIQTVCKLRYVDGYAKRARIQNLVPPLHFDDDGIDVSDDFIARIGQAFRDLSDRQNVVVRFVGFTDDAPLTGRVERIYGTPTGLSKARARRVALAVQDALDLPTAAVESDGAGATRPLASDDTERGRALNRRVEVEFWYDDPLKELPDEPQLCPDAPGAEVVTKVYDPPWGPIEHIGFADGQPVIPPGLGADIERAMADIADRTNVRVRFVGYTRNERLNRRTASVYGDDIGLSASRARRAMEAVSADLGLAKSRREFEGRGYLYSDDVVNAGFIQGDESYVAVQVVYDELALLDDYEGVEVTRLSREIDPENPLGLNLMRISVDGEPIDDPEKSSSDIQRCTDVAFTAADIRFGFDNLTSAPRLSVTAYPATVRVHPLPPTPPEAAVPGPPYDGWLDQPNIVGESVSFRMYTNYSPFIERAEVRIFDNGQSLRSEPLEVIPIELDGIAEWRPAAGEFRAPARELAYVLRAYGPDGNFDETLPRPLWLVYANAELPSGDGAQASPAPQPGLLAAWGENALATQNIGLSSGTVTVQGGGIPAHHEVWVAGRPVPVDAQGNFVSEAVLPTGMHTVEVAVLDEEGNGQLYLRDLEFQENDWFYVGMADLTLSSGETSGPMDLLAGDNADELDSHADGRLAFFVNGKFGDHWHVTASADTREGPLDTLFSNFMEKTPDALFRRIDPDYYYPTFGDDGTVEEMAPTMGKFFLRVRQRDSYAQWGNFKAGYMQNELAQVDRGLYGANVHYQSERTTAFGEQRFAADAFAAEPGTLPSREEFRGTGGSLYFLHRQDLLPGSERVRIEIRDKASGLVTGVVNLMPAMDYDIDYLQGRILLAEPLASTADDDLLVRSGALSGDEAWLVVRYEYTPGFEDVDALSTGGQVHYWMGEHVKLGLTASSDRQDDGDSTLQAADVTLRLSSESWLKLQGGVSDGIVSTAELSTDGGFGFTGIDPSAYADIDAEAYRADLSLATADLLDAGNGRLTLYIQDVEAGYSAPGLAVLADTRNLGGTLSLPLFEDLSLNAKLDSRVQEQGVETRAQEIDLAYRLSEHWDVSAGYRQDQRIDRSPLVPATQEQGERADAVLQLGYDSRADWNAWVFLQDTLSTTASRPENGRYGAGASYRVSERLRIDTEVSNGDLGPGGKLGTRYLHSERTSVYLNYTLENERTGNGLLPTRGGEGNLVAGIKSRFSDSASVYLEERYRAAGPATGLTHATGISLAPTERLNLGLSTDIGTLEDSLTGAETERRALGVHAGYGFDALQLSGAIEYRLDDVEQLDLGRNERETWLFRSGFKYQLSPSARLLGKLDHSDSTSSLGTFYDGGYTEAVVGYAYRPVYHDRLNALAKYTWFSNVPSPGQVTPAGSTAEFVQKSHVASLDLTYDLTPAFSIGGKYAYRLGQVSLDRENPEFFENDASLYVLRGDFRFREAWDLLVEGRLLDMPDLGEQRTGTLLTVSRQAGDHLKIGLGYNFSEFSDDLTDFDFDHRGFFLNLTGML